MLSVAVTTGLLAAWPGLASAAEPQVSGAEAEVRAFYERVNRVWAGRKLSELASELGPDAALVLHRPNGIQALDRAAFAAQLAAADLDQVGLTSHKIDLLAAHVAGEFALCETNSQNRFRDGRTGSAQGLTLLHRTPEGWRIVFHMPRFVASPRRTQVARVLPGSQAERVGIQVGDVVVRYGDRAIGAPRELIQAAQATAPEADVDLVVQRAGREQTLRAKGGRLGVHVPEVLEPGPGASTSGPAADEVRATLESLADAARRRDLDAFAAVFAEPAFVNCAIEGRTAKVIGREGLLRETREAFEPGKGRWETFRLVEARVIHKGPLALAQARVGFTNAEGREATFDILHALVRLPEGWRVVANITAFVHLASAAPAGEEAVVRRLAGEYAGAWNTEDAVPLDRIGTFLADDIRFVWSDGTTGAGKAALLDRTRQALAEIRQHFSALKTSFDVQSVRMSESGAVVLSRASLDGRLKEKDAPYRQIVWMTLVFAKTPAGWRIVHEHSTRAARP
jgi:ketosteroid isomerase-like protein